jgi:hypothetical protein
MLLLLLLLIMLRIQVGKHAVMMKLVFLLEGSRKWFLLHCLQQGKTLDALNNMSSCRTAPKSS